MTAKFSRAYWLIFIVNKRTDNLCDNDRILLASDWSFSHFCLAFFSCFDPNPKWFTSLRSQKEHTAPRQLHTILDKLIVTQMPSSFNHLKQGYVVRENGQGCLSSLPVPRRSMLEVLVLMLLSVISLVAVTIDPRGEGRAKLRDGQ